MTKALKFLLPVVAIALGIVVSVVLFVSRPKVEHKPLNIKAPLVTIAEVRATSQSIPVFTRGTVTPGTEIQLMSEVSGQVLELSPNFANGGFFRKGEVLIKVDPIEYEVNIKRAEASVAQARQAYLQAEAEKRARSRVKGNSTELGRYEAQFKQAQAQLEAAQAELQAVKLQRDRTIIRAPFDGRVRLAALNVGQYVRPGQQMGSIYAVDVAEVRLPLSDRQLSLVEVPNRFQDAQNPVFPEVTLTEKFAGRTYTWKGQVVRAEGGVDERNRLLYVVAQVRDPYSPDPNQPGRPELVAGSFVEATIDGRRFEKVFEVPRKALRNSSQLWVVDANSQLRERDVAIIYKGKDSIYISSGLQDGDRVVLSQMDIAVDGMTVRTKEEDNFQYEVEPKKTDNLFGAASSAENQTITLDDPRVKQLAEQAKQAYDNLDGEQKQQLKQNVQALAQQAKDLQAALKPASTPQPSAIPKPTEATEPRATEPKAPAGETPMSPLAAQIAEDLAEEGLAAEAAQVPAEPLAQPQPSSGQVATSSQPPAEPSAASTQSKPANAPQTAARSSVPDGKITISIVSAPEPLVEAVQ
ncbi:efflux RND transporter periplasmic adaptor subunit [Ketobacter sp.]|uniref:efflux RND transporter periplasmic adaptor subunit n=1 Tax=Ketobacter sp. TaxID=2083498 RepID=UPI000F11FC25|nr:efflux RND transporter periplasmic adaptor subunit [Ketobacter sp.]RLT97974.1 MAG: efflux RND transporter periplasmic adaptor subunit [Ketobacter sp.]